MEFLVRYKDVTLFKKENYGIKSVSFDIRPRRVYHLLLKDEEKIKTMVGLIEGRYSPDSGVIHRPVSFFLQSDRLLIEDKIMDKPTGRWLNLADDRFYFGGRRRSKRMFMEKLEARSIRHFPTYRLKGEDRLKFALLSMSFQETGLIIVSLLPRLDLSPILREMLVELIRNSECAVCLLTSLDNSRPFENHELNLEPGHIIDLTAN